MTQASADAGRQLHILLATDGTEWSDGAVRLAVTLAGAHNARLTAITMLLLDEDLEVVGTHGMRADEAEEAQARFALVNRLVSEAGISVTTQLRYGVSPHQEIVAAASELGADVVVMGRRGARGLAKMFVGHATLRTVAMADCPVLVVPKAAGPWKQRILLATDGSAHSQAALEAAGRYSQLSGLPVTVLSVANGNHSPERKAEAQQAVDAAVAELKARGVDAEPRVVDGKPDEVIAATAAEIGADLVVMGSHGRTGITKLLLGSVSERVIGALTCPALIAKPKK